MNRMLTIILFTLSLACLCTAFFRAWRNERTARLAAEAQLGLVPWKGDGSVPYGTLVPWWNDELPDGDIHPWGPHWAYRSDLRGFLDVPMWSECINGQGPVFIVDQRTGTSSR